MESLLGLLASPVLTNVLLLTIAGTMVYGAVTLSRELKMVGPDPWLRMTHDDRGVITSEIPELTAGMSVKHGLAFHRCTSRADLHTRNLQWEYFVDNWGRGAEPASRSTGEAS